MERIAFTTSIPVEILLAAQKIPVDLNNVFIADPRAAVMVEKAEEAGYPRNTCGWIKGLYTAALESQPEAVIAVMQGDCSNTLALMETLQLKGVPTIPFAFPFERDAEMLQLQIKKLQDYFAAGGEAIHEVKKQLDEIRKLCQQIDEMTWKDNLVSGGENHYYLVSSSDFNSDPLQFKQDMENFIADAGQREPFRQEIRLAYIGVPPIFTDLYTMIESMGARVVFNEVQRQFSMPYKTADINQQYLMYTYPYGAFARLQDILEEISLRRVDGVIHYTQTFCFRQIEDMIFREKIKLPFLTLEGEGPGKLDGRSRMRLEAFINMLK